MTPEEYADTVVAKPNTAEGVDRWNKIRDAYAAGQESRDERARAMLSVAPIDPNDGFYRGYRCALEDFLKELSE